MRVVAYMKRYWERPLFAMEKTLDVSSFDDVVSVEVEGSLDCESDAPCVSSPQTPTDSCLELARPSSANVAHQTHRLPFANAYVRQLAAHAAMMIRSAYTRTNGEKVFPYIDLDLGVGMRPLLLCEDPMHIVSGACALFRAVVNEIELERRGLDQAIRKLMAVCLLTVYKVRSESAFVIRQTMKTVAVAFLYPDECPDSEEEVDDLQEELTKLEFCIVTKHTFLSIVDGGVAAAIDAELYAHRNKWNLCANDIVNLIALANFHHFAALSLDSSDPVEELVYKGMSVAELGRVFVLVARGSILMLTGDAARLHPYPRAFGRAAAVIARHTRLAVGTNGGLRIGSFLNTQTVVGACVTADALQGLVRLFV